MKPIVIFGCTDAGQLAHFYFSHDSSRQVAAFTVDGKFKESHQFCGLPVVEFERVAMEFPPSEFDLFVALGYSRVNKFRAEKVAEAKSKGYLLATYVSTRATVLTHEPFGENCFVLEDNTIQPFARIGHNVTLWSGNHIGHHAVIGDHCFVTSHVVISGRVKVGPYCFLGVNATLRDHIEIGEGSVIGAGALILADVPPQSVYTGIPGKLSRVSANRLSRL